jgi:hypothetical protein
VAEVKMDSGDLASKLRKQFEKSWFMILKGAAMCISGIYVLISKKARSILRVLTFIW